MPHVKSEGIITVPSSLQSMLSIEMVPSAAAHFIFKYILKIDYQCPVEFPNVLHIKLLAVSWDSCQGASPLALQHPAPCPALLVKEQLGFL